MTKYREILRLIALGLSQRNIIHSIGVSQKTIVTVQHRAQELKLANWPNGKQRPFSLIITYPATEYYTPFLTNLSNVRWMCG